MKVSVKRAYEEAEPGDGYRVLVDRMWPRGVSREALTVDEWAKDIAPSAQLRQWFGHDPERWERFRERYEKELASPAQRARLQAMRAAAGNKALTLVYCARDEEHNNAVVLRDIFARMRRTSCPSSRSKQTAPAKRRTVS